MRVLSAFFADNVGVYEQKLFVTGGVWDRYSINPADLPTVRVMQMALILEVAPDDRGARVSVTIQAHKPDTTTIEPLILNLDVAGDYPTDYLVLPVALNMPLDELGRYVVVVDAGSPEGALTVPLKVIPLS